jgi:peptidylprolyl isomerase
MAFLTASLKTLLIGLLGLIVSFFLGSQPSGGLIAQAATGLPLIAYLPPGNAITDGQALLRYALPIDCEAIREVQAELEELSDKLRGKRWGPVQKTVAQVERRLDRNRDKILAAVPTTRQAQADAILTAMGAAIEPLRQAVERQDKAAVLDLRRQLLGQVTALEDSMVEGFPFEVPADYRNLPQLKGRATVVVETTQGPVTVVVDGYSAPVTAGNFVDLVQRGFYDGRPFIRAEDFYVLQTGDPEGPEEGFVDPKTGQYRAIPLEILVKGDSQPVYGETLEALGRYMDDPVLPFSAFGTVAMARPEADPNGGSSQFFFFLFEPELTPAGLNLLDGRYSVFGYVVEGKEVLRQLKQGDAVKSMRVVDGLDHLVQPA